MYTKILTVVIFNRRGHFYLLFTFFLPLYMLVIFHNEDNLFLQQKEIKKTKDSSSVVWIVQVQRDLMHSFL